MSSPKAEEDKQMVYHTTCPCCGGEHAKEETDEEPESEDVQIIEQFITDLRHVQFSEEKTVNYKKSLVPLHRLVTLLPELREIASEIHTDKNDEKYWAFSQMLDFVESLWNSTGRNAQETKKWEVTKMNMYFSLIKETFCFGNTSVSMGMAVEHESTQNLNCGGGGIKYQLYSKYSDFGVASVAEYKPGAFEKGSKVKFPSPNELTPDDLKNNERLQLFGEQLNASINDFWIDVGLPSKYIEKAKELYPFKAFVTGNLREKWLKAPVETKEFLENAMRIYFAAADVEPSHPNGYFISPETEAQCEYIGTENMHDNLGRASYISDDFFVVSTLGIGKNSTQFSIGTDSSINEPLGMAKKGEPGDGPGKRIAKRLSKELFCFHEKVAQYPDFCKIVIALKSGCSLLFSENSRLLQAMQDDGSFPRDAAQDLSFRLQESIWRMVQSSRDNEDVSDSEEGTTKE